MYKINTTTIHLNFGVNEIHRTKQKKKKIWFTLTVELLCFFLFVCLTSCIQRKNCHSTCNTMYASTALVPWIRKSNWECWIRVLARRDKCQLELKLLYLYLIMLREKRRDLTQSYDKSPYTNRNVKTAKWQHKQTKSLITQQLQTDLGRSVGVTMATQLVWLTWFMSPTFPLPATAVQSKGHTFKNL